MIENSDRIKVMINEYNAMKDLRELQIHQLDNRVELYLKMISVAVTVIPALSFLVVPSLGTIHYTWLFVIILFITLMLLYFGVFSFFRVVEGHISIVEYTRGMNRVRRFFYDRDEDIRQYLSMPIADDVPAFGSYGFSFIKTIRFGYASLVIALNIMNALLIEMNILYLLYKVFNIQIGMTIFLIVIALVLVALYYRVLCRTYNKRMEKAHIKSSVRFPTEK